MSDDENSKVVKAEKKPFVTRSLYDVQRIRLEKLMKNPDKPVEIPERRKEKAIPEPPDFVRNVMGSSAGAGSGEFHVYRHIRRREYARQRHIKIIAEKEEKDSEYQQKLEENKRIANEKTAKRRAKRLKKKQKAKKPKKGGNNQKSESESDDSEESSQEENDILDKDNDASRDAKDSAKFDVKDKADTDLSQDNEVDGPSLNDAEKSNS